MKFKCLIFNIKGNKKMAGRGLGAHRLAYHLRENNWNAEVIDYADSWTFDQLKALFLARVDENLKFVGFSWLFSKIEVIDVELFTHWIRQNYPDVKILIGGPTKFVNENVMADWYINGWAEFGIIELLKYLFSNGTSPKFQIINGKKHINCNTFYPAFPMKNLRVLYEDRDFLLPHECVGIEFSRGCKFSCSFCNFPVLGVREDHTRTAEDFEIQMRDTYDRYGITKYFVADETFNDSTEKITKYADVVEKLNFEPFFTGFIRPDLIVSRKRDREELLRMHFLGHYYGVESFNTESGKAIGKGMESSRLKSGLIDVRNYFETHGTKRFRGTISLIIGLPKETIESIRETKQWLVDNWQGQHFTIWQLEIPVSTEYDNPSLLTQNWQKYGYTDAKDDLELTAFVQKTQKEKHDFIYNTLIWKNEHMNIKQAIELRQEFDEINKKYDFRTGNYSLMLTHDEPRTLDEFISDPGNTYSRPFTKTLNSYIQKKLDWKKNEGN